MEFVDNSCLITRASILKRCKDREMYKIYTENERPCEEAFLDEVYDINEETTSRFFIEWDENENFKDIVENLKKKYNLDIIVVKNKFYPIYPLFIILDEEIEFQEEYEI